MRNAFRIGNRLRDRRVSRIARFSVRAMWVITLICHLAASSLPAAATVSKAESGRQTRQSAMDEIPFEKLNPQARQRIHHVVQNPSMFRRMPISIVDCEPNLYQFLVRHPEVVVNIWQLMGITQVQTKRIGPYLLDALDGMGTNTSIELIYGTSDTHLFYCDGHYEGPLFRKPVTGRCVLLLKAGYVPTDDGRWHITNRLDIFLQVDHVGVDAFTRTLHPLLGKSADVNFAESVKFLERISRTSERSGPGMQRLADRLENVEPEVRDKFSRITQQVHESSQQRLASRPRSD